MNKIKFPEKESPDKTIVNSVEEHLLDVTKFVRDAHIKPEIDLTDPVFARSKKKKSLSDYMTYVAHK